MRITIVGGGNIGMQFAVHCAQNKNEVIVYTSEPGLFEDHLAIVDEFGRITYEGDIACATNDPEKAFAESELILVTVPAFMMDQIAKVVYMNTNEKTVIGVVPGYGGAECAFRDCIERGNVFFGIERVPAIARIVKKGKTVKSVGYRKELHVASLPHEYAGKCAEMVGNLFDMPCKVIPNYLNLTLTPSNPILHTCRLFTLFKDWHEGMKYNRVPLFYEEWDDDSSELLIACDDELQMICRALRDFDLSYVKSLREHYESQTAEEMTIKISGIPAFKGISAPVVRTESGYLPDLSSRYFIADFPYGLNLIKQVSRFADVKTPNIDGLMEWYKRIAIGNDEFNYADYGITDYEQFAAFYRR